MKKLLVLALSVLALVALSSLPAQAVNTNHGNLCHQYFSSNGKLAVKLCVRIQDDGNHQWRAQAQSYSIAGYGAPVYLGLYALRFWSSTRSGQGPYCDGRVPACTAGGDVDCAPGSCIWAVNSIYNSAWLGAAEHWIYVHSEVFAVIQWTASNEFPDFNSQEISTL